MRRETEFVLEEAPWPALLLEQSGHICRANDAARHAFGVAADSPAALAEFWTDDTVSPAEFLTEACNQGTSELQLRLSDGEELAFIAQVAQVLREGEVYFVLQLFNVPEAAFAAPAQDAPGSPHATAPAPIEIFDAEWPMLLVNFGGKIVKANASAARFFGPGVERPNASLKAIWSPRNHGLLESILTSQEEAPLHFRLRDGTYGCFDVQVCPAGSGDLLLLQFFKKAEPLAPKAALTRDSAFLLENSEWPVLLTDKSGRILRANRAAVWAFGADLDRQGEMLTDYWQAQPGETIAETFVRREKAVLCNFRLKTGMHSNFLVHCSEAGPEEHYLLQLFRLAETVGQVPGSKPKPEANIPASPEAAPGPSQEASRQILERMQHFAQTVALDLNNTLTSILGHASLVLSKADPKHPWRNSLVEIEKSACKAAEIATELAAFSRSERDTRAQMAGNLNNVIERTIEILRASYPHVTWTTQFERKLFTCNFDEARVQQAFLKLFENAVEAIAHKNGRISAHTRNLELTEPLQDRTARLKPGNYACVEISDNGEGIAPEVLPRIFEPFFTTRGSKHRGLGLAWVYGIITSHDGGIAFSSQPGVGTSVRVYIPAYKRIVKQPVIPGDDLKGNQTILMVDDEDLLLTMGQMVLSSFGYTVLTANSGQKALDIFTNSKTPIDLVITDLIMPNMNGHELTELIQRISPKVRFIWCSGRSRAASAREQESYLQKPFTSQELLRKVKQALSSPG